MKELITVETQLRMFSDMEEHEKVAVDIFMKSLPKENYIVLAGAYAKKNIQYNTKREIDIILICPKGIFSIEMKDWHGTNKTPIGMNDRNIDLIKLDGHSTISIRNPFQKVYDQKQAVANEIKGKLNRFSQRNLIEKLNKVNTIGILLLTDNEFRLKVKENEDLLYFNLNNVKDLWERKYKNDVLTESEIKAIVDVFGEGHGKILKNFNVGSYIGDYKIEKLIYAGENYKVYKALNSRLNRYYFLKAVAINPTFVKEKVRLVEEMANRDKEAASILEDNPHILFSDFPSFYEGDYIINITKWIEHLPLAEAIKNGLKDEEKISLIKQLIETIDAIHENSIVHRDLNSHNIIITKDNAVKIMNFDFAKLQGKMTMKDFILGKEDMYRAPELMNYSGEPITKGADYYSLGVVIHEIIKGDYPFKQFSDKFKFTLDFSMVKNDLLRELEKPLYLMLSNAPMERSIGFSDLKERLK